MDPVTIYSLASATVTFIDAATRVARRIHELSEAGRLPQELTDVRLRLPIIQEIISQTGNLEESLGQKAQEAFRKLVINTQAHVESLERELQKLTAGARDNKWIKIGKAVRSLRKENKIDRISQALRDNITLITQLQPIPTQSQASQCANQRRPSECLLDAFKPGIKPAHFMVPFPRDPGFVDREDILALIESGFEKNGRVSVAGQGGVGKSQVAIEYAYRFKEANPEADVFWIYGGSESRFYQGYRRVAQKLELPGWDDPDLCPMTLVCEALSTRPDRYLFILDNADDLALYWPEKFPASCADALNLASFIPNGSSEGRVLITSRHFPVAQRLMSRGQPIRLGPLSEEGALRLFKSMLDGQDWLGSASEKEIVKALDCLPLAVTQAAAFINSNHMSADEYLEALESNDVEELLDEELHDERRDNESINCTFRSWHLSFKQIEKRNPGAAEFLSLLAIFDRQSIPTILFQSIKKTTMAKYIGYLKDFHMIGVHGGSGSLNMHRLTQHFLLLTLKESGTLQLFRNEALACLARVHPTVIGPNEWDQCDLLSPHVDALTAHEYTSGEARENYAHLLCWAADFDIERGLYEESLVRAKQSYDIFKAVVDPHDQRYLSAAWMYGRIRFYTARCDDHLMEAASVLRDTFSRSEDYSFSYTEAAFELSYLYFFLGKEKECLEMSKTAFTAWEVNEGSDSHRCLDERHDYALHMALFGHEEEAIRHWSEIIARTPNSDATENIKRVYRLRSLACIAEFENQADCAGDLYLQLINICSAIYSPSHVHVFDYKLSLAEQIMRQGRYEEAIAKSEDVIRTCQNKSEWRIMASAYETIAECHRRQNEYAAEHVMRVKYLELPTKYLGETNIETIEGKQALARSLINNSKFPEALELLNGILRWREHRQGPEHKDTVTTMELLGICQYNMGQYVEACDSFLLAFSRSNNEETTDTAGTTTEVVPQKTRLLANLSCSLWNLNNWSAVETRCLEILSGYDGDSSSAGSDCEDVDDPRSDDVRVDDAADIGNQQQQQQPPPQCQFQRRASLMLVKSLEKQGKVDDALAHRADSSLVPFADEALRSTKQQQQEFGADDDLLRISQPPYDLQETRRFGRIIHPRSWSS